jgi:hypothetical protein
MTGKKPTLEYEPSPPQRWSESAGFFVSAIRLLVLLNLYWAAIIGPVFAVLGVISFFRPNHGLALFGRGVVTLRDKIEWVVSAAAISVIAVPLAAWHIHRVLRGCRR